MAKAIFVLPNGTNVTIDGTADEIQRLLSIYGGDGPTGAGPKSLKTKPKAQAGEATKDEQAPKATVNLSEVINLVRTCPEAEDIEQRILDGSRMVDRTLLPLYIIHEHLGNAFALTSGQISQVTKDLGILVSASNVSTTLSTTAARYVVGDRVRKPGIAVHYKLSRRGLHYMQQVISRGGAANERVN